MAGNPKMAAVWAACRVLGFEQRQLGEFAGSSLRTVQRWSAGQSSPSYEQMVRLAAATYPHDPQVASQLAAVLGQSLESLGIVRRPAPPAPAQQPLPAANVPLATTTSPALAQVLAEALVAAAAEALDVPPRGARPAVLAVMERAKATGLSIDDLLAALRAASPGPAPGPPAPGTPS